MAVSVRAVSLLLFPSTEPACKPKALTTELVAGSLLPGLLSCPPLTDFWGILPGGSMMQRIKHGGVVLREPQWVYRSARSPRAALFSRFHEVLVHRNRLIR